MQACSVYLRVTDDDCNIKFQSQKVASGRDAEIQCVTFAGVK